MTTATNAAGERFLRTPTAERLRRPAAVMQPVLARKGKPSRLPGQPFEVDGKTLVIARCKVLETTHHGLPHCETTALLEFENLEKLVDNISREHTVIVYGDHVRDLSVLADALGLTSVIC
jgi:hypothetical protein